MSKSHAGNAYGTARGGHASHHHGGGRQHQQQHGQRNSAANSGTNSPRTGIAASQVSAQTSAQADANSIVVKELKSLLGQPVRLTLDNGNEEVGLLWSYDVGMGIVALEVPKAASTALQQQQQASGPTGITGTSSQQTIPSTAAAYPTAILSSVKVAAQGGDASGARTTFTVVKLRRVQKAKRLQKSSAAGQQEANVVQALEAAKVTAAKSDVNVAAAEARERAATGEALKRAAKLGVGVSSLGQRVFDALNKTLPCRWADQHIIVMDEFVISPDKYDAVTVPNVATSTLQAIARGEKVNGVSDDLGPQATRWQRVAKVLEGERKKLLATDAN